MTDLLKPYLSAYPLELYWNPTESGNLEEKVHNLEDVFTWSFADYPVGYKTSFKNALWRMELSKYPLLGVSVSNKQVVTIQEMLSKRILEKLLTEECLKMYEKVIKLQPKTRVYIFRCAKCGEYTYCTLNALVDRLNKYHGLYCKDCCTLISTLDRNGSLKDYVPEVERYYTSNNKLKFEDAPAVELFKEKPIKSELVCPRCGRVHQKVNKTILQTGALCNSCAKVKKMREEGKIKSLKEAYPDIAKSFDLGGNKVSSRYVSPSSDGTYNFYCNGSKRFKNPHIFSASIYNVIKCKDNRYGGCPICAGKQIKSGVNDFETLNPVGSSMWDYSKNDITPDKVYAYSEDQYWFKCKNGHEFQRDPLHMMRSIDSKTCGCPVCYGRRVIVGVNDMATTMPDTLDRWEYDLNDFTPHDVTEGSNRKMLARCQVKSCRKVYETDVYSWSHNLVRRCPDCRNSQISTSEQNIVDMISGYGIKVEQQYPIAGGKYLLDAYLPEKGIAFEYNGIYWHSAEKRGLTYHEDKYSTASKFGITLYNIWSDDYDRNPDLVCKLIKKKIQPVLSDLSSKEFDLSFIDREAAEPFILKNSLVPLQDYQYSGESEYIGIFLNGLLAATAQLREVDDNTIEIYGYCELLSVPEKERLLEEFCKTNTGYSIIRVVHEISSIGDLLNRMGTLWKTLPPKGYFVLGTQRVEQLPEDLYQEEYRDLSIEQVSQKSGIEILYNVGYEVWEKEI